MEFEIPKEIKSKPQLLGLEMKELIILVVSFFFIFTVFKDMVHGLFTIPFFIIAIGTLLYMLMPSNNNPQMKNYMSVLLFLKRNRDCYHSLDYQGQLNKEFYAETREEGEVDGR